MRASLDTRSCSLAATAATQLVSVCIHPHPHTTSCLSVFLKKATPRPHSGVVTTSGAPSPRALLAPVQDSFDLCAWTGKRRMGMGWHTPVPSSSLSYWLPVSLAGNLVACGIHLTFSFAPRPSSLAGRRGCLPSSGAFGSCERRWRCGPVVWGEGKALTGDRGGAGGDEQIDWPRDGGTEKEKDEC